MVHKYRAWDVLKKKYVYDGDVWCPAGYQGKYQVTITSHGILFTVCAGDHGYVSVIDKNGKQEHYYASWDYESLASENLILEEFVHKQDVAEKDIYDGDKVRILYTDWPSQSDYSISLEEYKKSISSYGFICWHETGWYIKINAVLCEINPGRHGEIEIIGNIHEGMNK